MSFEVLYQDNSLLIINKPPGLLSVPGKNPAMPNLFEQVLEEFPNARVVHRLDQATSGIILMALSYECQRGFAKLFEIKAIEKTYRADVYGKLAEAYGEVDIPLICDWPNRPKQKVDFNEGKRALTYYEMDHFCSSQNRSTITLKPITGRSHQLRMHMLYLGHPIIGDPFYAPAQARYPNDRLHLHASRIRFQHPISDEKIDIISEPDF